MQNSNLLPKWNLSVKSVACRTLWKAGVFAQCSAGEGVKAGPSPSPLSPSPCLPIPLSERTEAAGFVISAIEQIELADAFVEGHRQHGGLA